MIDNSDLKSFFDDVISEINCAEFIQTDPVQFPHRYDDTKDQEIAGFLTALIAWGRREMIIRNAEKMLQIMGPSPYQWIINSGFEDLNEHTVHRTFNSSDLKFISKGLKAIYTQYDSMEELFLEKDMFDGISSLRDKIIQANNIPGYRSEKHLSDPKKNSACKRIHMFLKWMVRKDHIIDLGIWKNISPASLYIPLDTHVIQVSQHFGLLTRKQNDKKSVIELTSILKSFRPDDPVIYDYALFGLGIKGYLKE